jgi:hypothetical protein
VLYHPNRTPDYKYNCLSKSSLDVLEPLDRAALAVPAQFLMKMEDLNVLMQGFRDYAAQRYL